MLQTKAFAVYIFINLKTKEQINRLIIQKEPSGTGLPKSNPKCGRPLGLRLRGNIIYVADAFYGIVKIDITTGKRK